MMNQLPNVIFLFWTSFEFSPLSHSLLLLSMWFTSPDGRFHFLCFPPLPRLILNTLQLLKFFLLIEMNPERVHFRLWGVRLREVVPLGPAKAEVMSRGPSGKYRLFCDHFVTASGARLAVHVVLTFLGIFVVFFYIVMVRDIPNTIEMFPIERTKYKIYNP